jgi:hypothetical protein
MLEFEYLENKSAIPPVEDAPVEAAEEEVDFGML